MNSLSQQEGQEPPIIETNGSQNNNTNSQNNNTHFQESDDQMNGDQLPAHMYLTDKIETILFRNIRELDDPSHFPIYELKTEEEQPLTETGHWTQYFSTEFFWTDFWTEPIPQVE